MAPALKNNLGGFVTGVTKVLHKMLPDKAKLIKPKTGMACRNPQITEDILNDKWSFVERTSLSTI